MVVRRLDTDADGKTDALDADGDDLPDDLDGDGSFSDETSGLSDPAAHPPHFLAGGRGIIVPGTRYFGPDV